MKALQAGEQETGIDFVATDTAKSTSDHNMQLTAWIGTDIKKVGRKKGASANYVMVIMEKDKIQTWKDVETHLWKEYEKNWNSVK